MSNAQSSAGGSRALTHSPAQPAPSPVESTEHWQGRGFEENESTQALAASWGISSAADAGAPPLPPAGPPAVGYSFSNVSIYPGGPLPVQTQLTIGQPNDPYEQEADRVADQVMRMSAPPPPAQHQDIEEDGGPDIQRSPDQAQPTAPQPNLETRLNASRSGGRPLPNEVRQFMEPRFGFDFSKVKVHNDADAVQMNQELGAQAFTHGSHIYYGAGKAPAKDELTGHELTHVVQQTGNIQRQSILQLSPLSEEVTQLWNIEKKAAFFHRLRQLDDNQRRDEDLRQWVDQHLRRNDRWLADHILVYGSEANWPIEFRVEREMQGWTDSGGAEAVFDILREAHGTEARNTDLSDTLRRIFRDNSEYLATAIQLQHHHRTAQDIDSNAVELTYQRGTRDLDQPTIRRIQQRLIELDCLHETDQGFAWGFMNDTTQRGIAEFQTRHADEIQRIRTDIQTLDRDMQPYRERQAPLVSADTARGFTSAVVSSTSAARSREGVIEEDDVTHQALTNAWPRQFFGVSLANETEAYRYIECQVERRGLPFDENRVNVVGVRGFQGGGTHDNEGSRHRDNQYDDTFFVLARQNGAPRLWEFRGTTDPGGRTVARGQADPRTHEIGADQQFNYRFNYTASEKFGRPMLGQVSGTPEAPGVVDPRRQAVLDVLAGTDPEAREDLEAARTREPIREDAERDRPASEAIRPGGSSERDDRYDRVRTEFGEPRLPRHPEYGGYSEKEQGIALHSGGGSDQVFADSTGCQVIHGDWYGSFIQTLRRSLAWSRGESAPADGGDVLYSIIDGREMLPPSREITGNQSAATTCAQDLQPEADTATQVEHSSGNQMVRRLSINHSALPTTNHGSQRQQQASGLTDVVLERLPNLLIQRECGQDESCMEDSSPEQSSSEAPTAETGFDELVSSLLNRSVDDSTRQTTVRALTAWCRTNLPDRNLLRAYLNAPTPTEAAIIATAQATIATLEAQANSMSMTGEDVAAASTIVQEATTQIQEAHQLAAEEKTRIIGQLAIEVARMEFLLGWMYQGGLNQPNDPTWESPENRGEFPSHYQEEMQTHARQQGAPWCTSFAGYAYSQIGFQFNQQQSSSTARSIFWSGSRLRRWALTGQSNSGTQLTPEGQRVIDPQRSGALIDRSDWAALRQRLQSISDVEERRRAVSEFFTARTHPQPGDFLILGQNNNFRSGGSSHTALVEQYNSAEQKIFTVEGNADDAVRGRRIDLTNPDDVSKIVFITRLGVEYFTSVDQSSPTEVSAASASTSQASGEDNEQMSSVDTSDAERQQLTTPSVTADKLLDSIRNVNSRLVELSSSHGWINNAGAGANVYDLGSSQSQQGGQQIFDTE